MSVEVPRPLILTSAYLEMNVNYVMIWNANASHLNSEANPMCDHVFGTVVLVNKKFLDREFDFEETEEMDFQEDF